MSRRIRQYTGLFAAVIAYYVVHEGAHLVTALHYGVFKRLNFIGRRLYRAADRQPDGKELHVLPHQKVMKGALP